MNNALKRALKKVKKREVQKMNSHLERMGAAFIQETGLRASETSLVQRDLDSGMKEYTFTKRYWNPADTSPEVQEMFAICMELARAESQEQKDEGIKLLQEFIKKVGEEEGEAVG